MAKVSFKRNDTAPSAVATATPDENAAIVEQAQGPGAATTAVAVRPSYAPPAPSTPYSEDDIDMKDVILPRLNIVQKVGDLSNVFPPGSFVLDGELALPSPLRIVVLGFAPKRYAEKVAGGARGNMFNSVEEVAEAGGTLDYNEAKAKEIPLYQTLATALTLIEKPEGVAEEIFPYEFGGKRYNVALWGMKGTAYTNGARIFFTAKRMGGISPALVAVQKEGYRAAVWTFETKLAKTGPNFYYIPLLKAVEITTPEFRAWVGNEVIGF